MRWLALLSLILLLGCDKHLDYPMLPYIGPDSTSTYEPDDPIPEDPEMESWVSPCGDTLLIPSGYDLVPGAIECLPCVRGAPCDA